MMDDTPLRAYLRHLALDEGVRTVHDLTDAQLLSATKAYLRGPDVHEEHLDGDDRATLVRLTTYWVESFERRDHIAAGKFAEFIASNVIRAARMKAVHRVDEILTEMRAEADCYRDSAEMARDLMAPARSVV